MFDVIIPNSVTRIERHAFYGCKEICSIEIPENVSFVGEDAFKGVINVVTNNSSFKNNGADFTNAYIDDEDLSLLYTDASQKKIVGCYKSNIIAPPVPNSVREIVDGAFEDSELVSLTIPYGVKRIGKRLFKGCRNLCSVDIPESVTEIGDSAFESCSDLMIIDIPNSVTSIGDHAFKGCDKLVTVAIPNYVTKIGNNAFESCRKLKRIFISNSVVHIGENVFADCQCLKEIIVPKDQKQQIIELFKKVGNNHSSLIVERRCN